MTAPPPNGLAPPAIAAPPAPVAALKMLFVPG